MNVLSLFDGMSCGQLALRYLRVRDYKYFASEVDKHAIKITQKNYPETIQIGDVRKVSYKNGVLYTEDGEYEIGPVNYLFAGSPCQNLSVTVINNSKHNKGLQGEKSKLFYDFLRILEEAKPDYFLYENVGTMKDQDKEVITELLKTPCLHINSSDFTAQDRSRYYWTNVEVDPVEYKEDFVHEDMVFKAKHKHVLEDILMDVEDVPDKYWYEDNLVHNVNLEDRVCAYLDIKGHDILKRVYNPKYKSPTLTAVTGGNHQKKVFQNGRARKLMPIEYERLQGVRDGYTEGVSDTQRWCMLGNGWTVPVIMHILKNNFPGHDKFKV